MSKRKSSAKSTSTGRGKGKDSTGDEPEGRPTNRPRHHLVARPPPSLVRRPTGHLVSRPSNVGVGTGRGGSSSASGNGDKFADDRADIGEYIDDRTRHVVRTRVIHGGRGGRSSDYGDGDRFVDERADIRHNIDEGNRPMVQPRGIHAGRGGRSGGYGNGDRLVDERNRDVVRPRGIHGAGRGSSLSATREEDRFEDDYMEDPDEGMDEPDMESSQRRRGSNIADTPPNESSQRTWIYPYQNGFTEARVHRQITAIFKYSFDGSWATWKEVPKRDIKLMWERFQETYQWDARVKALVEKNFKDYLSKRFSDVMRECRLEAARRANEAGTPLVDQDFEILKPYPPVWIDPEDWSDMIDRVWNTVEWKKKSKAGRKNRSTLVDGQVSKHTAGSIRIDQHRLRMEKERGGPVSSLEVYQRCHTKKGSVSEYITTRAKKVADKYSDLMEEKYGADPECHPRVGDRELWERACGGPSKKGRFFGFGSPMDIDLVLTGTPSTPSTGNSDSHQSSVASSEEVENLKGQLAEQEKAAQERERVAKELQQAAEERERAAEQRVKELEEQVKDIAEMLKTLKPPPSPPS